MGLINLLTRGASARIASGNILFRRDMTPFQKYARSENAAELGPVGPDLGPSPADIERAIGAARSCLLSIQREDGHWCGELEGDTILESEYILAMYFISSANEERLHQAANYIRQKTLPEGGWTNYPGGPPDVSSSIKAYVVLKLLGDHP